MKTVVDKNGKFMFTFSGGEIDMSDPSLKDCQVIDGDAPLKEYEAKLKVEGEQIQKETDAWYEAEHNWIDGLETRIASLEQEIINLKSQ